MWQKKKTNKSSHNMLHISLIIISQASLTTIPCVTNVFHNLMTLSTLWHYASFNFFLSTNLHSLTNLSKRNLFFCARKSQLAHRLKIFRNFFFFFHRPHIKQHPSSFVAYVHYTPKKRKEKKKSKSFELIYSSTIIIIVIIIRDRDGQRKAYYAIKCKSDY
jgi:hypothetical protein